MVKVAKTAKKKTGRPAADPAEIRSERTALRMHPDLQTELSVAAREKGITRSLLIEQILLAAINQRLWQRGERMLDGIGKYLSDAEMERAHAAVDASHQADFRQRTMDYGAPPVLRQSPVPGGLPRWAPGPAQTPRKK
jgi:hypothetical protein